MKHPLSSSRRRGSQETRYGFAYEEIPACEKAELFTDGNDNVGVVTDLVSRRFEQNIKDIVGKGWVFGEAEVVGKQKIHLFVVDGGDQVRGPVSL